MLSYSLMKQPSGVILCASLVLFAATNKCSAQSALEDAPLLTGASVRALLQKSVANVRKDPAMTLPPERLNASQPSSFRKPTVVASQLSDEAVGQYVTPALSVVGPPLALQGPSSVSMKAAAAEFLAMALLVIIGCGTAMGMSKENGSASVLHVSLAFGFACSSLGYAIGHISGGQINCAVTLSLVLVGRLSARQGLLNFAAQVVGSVVGASVLSLVYPPSKDRTGSLGANIIIGGWSPLNALVAELVLTFFLVFVVLETTVDPDSTDMRSLSCLAIGFAVFLAHSVLIPIDGCSINPTRSFGPAFVTRFSVQTNAKMKSLAVRDQWVFWVGPLSGACAAASCYQRFRAA
eukprot:TRINITY_DN34570_c0_g1_i4.p1 TRINITY_DN34570_c0_g1~~TRINITY_DN34570_c0_g1_i4.p1  ORF type:complete len:350 (+),score=40.33 TRINITY_DN34570_c0_g1_i4:79-1128(+)